MLLELLGEEGGQMGKMGTGRTSGRGQWKWAEMERCRINLESTGAARGFAVRSPEWRALSSC